MCKILVGITICALFGCSGQPLSGPPNIIFILIDTLRADHLPFYGYEINTAPFLADLAKEGAVFDRAYSTSSATSPATASIMTSTYPIQHGVMTNLHALRFLEKQGIKIPLNRIPGDVATLAEALREGGYRTFGVTDNINVSEDLGFDRGFDRYANSHYINAVRVNEVIAEWAPEILGSAPFFLYVHYMDPHIPYHRRMPWYEERLDANPDLPPDPGRRGFTIDKKNPSPLLAVAYDSEISFLDKAIRELFELLDPGRNTAVIVTSDHGEELWDHGDIGHTHSLYNELIRVPFVVAWRNGGIPARRIPDPIGVIDIAPTILGIAGIESPPSFEGENLTNWLIDGKDGLQRNGTPSGERLFLAELKRRNLTSADGEDLSTWASIQGGWKSISTSVGGNQLFRLDGDFGEVNDLIDSLPGVAEKLRSVGERFRKSLRRYSEEDVEITLSPEEQEHLRALGYIR